MRPTCIQGWPFKIVWAIESTTSLKQVIAKTPRRLRSRPETEKSSLCSEPARESDKESVRYVINASRKWSDCRRRWPAGCKPGMDVARRRQRLLCDNMNSFDNSNRTDRRNRHALWTSRLIRLLYCTFERATLANGQRHGVSMSHFARH